MGLRQVAGHIVTAGRVHGTAGVLHYLALRTVNRAVYLEILRVLAIQMSDVRDRGRFDAPGFCGRFVPRGEWSDLARNPESQISTEFLNGAAQRGDRCYAVFHGRSLAAYSWYGNRTTPFDEHFDLAFDNAWTYVYKGFTLPGWRGRRLLALGMCGALQAVTDEGKLGLIGCAASTNVASLQSGRWMGYRAVGTVALFRVGGRGFSLATRDCRAFGLRAVPVSGSWSRQMAGATSSPGRGSSPPQR
jgi:hypothetical protein